MTATNLDLRLFNADDDARDIALKQIIQSVISASSSPAEAAGQAGQWIADAAEKAWLDVKDKEIKSVNSPFRVCPNPRRDYTNLVGYVATVCSAYPPGHAAQENLAELIREIRSLPEREMRQYTSSTWSDEESIEVVTDLWKDNGPPIRAFLDESAGKRRMRGTITPKIPRLTDSLRT